jgi:hypothetical protein
MHDCWQLGVLLLPQQVRLMAAAEVVPRVVLLLALARSAARCGSTTGAHQLLGLALLGAGVMLLPLLLLRVAMLLVAGVAPTVLLLLLLLLVATAAVLARLVLCWQALVV